uniref:G-protein coupled receptors family 3 profile domain-containing protein n=1 Tax=Xenopus tropicalis TaxID=8364 RepID=A0A803K1J9_XENTR
MNLKMLKSVFTMQLRCLHLFQISTIISLVLLVTTSLYFAVVKGNKEMCLLEGTTLQSSFRDGDVILGAVMSLYNFPTITKYTFKEKPLPSICCGAFVRYYRHVLVIIFAIEEINRNPLLLPNVTLGYEIYDSCDYVSKAVEATLKLFSGRQDHVPGYRCTTKGPLAAFIGLPYSMAELTQIYRYPHISYGTQDPILDDKTLFPSFFRIVPNDRAMYNGYVQLLHYFGWTWVGLVASDEEHNMRTSQELRAVLYESGICIAYFAVVSSHYAISYVHVVNVIKESKANVVIPFCNHIVFLHLIYSAAQNAQHGRVWIIPASLSFFTDKLLLSILSVLSGSLQFSTHREEIPGFQDFLYSINPTTFPNFVAAGFWNDIFLCLPPNKAAYRALDDPQNNCTGNESLKSFDNIFEIKTFRVTYAIYRAVYSFAIALHKMLSSMQLSGYQLNLRNSFQPTMLTQYLKNLHLQTKSKENVYTTNEGLIGQYDIMNWVTSKGTVTLTEIGSFFPFAPQGQQLIINNSDIKWNHKFKQVPISTCSTSCLSGYRKATQKGQPVCCFDCILCSEDEFSNESDSTSCTKCPEDMWANEMHDGCRDKTLEFLSFEEALGGTLAAFSVVGSLFPLSILFIFLRNADTPVVKANNRNLSYILLVSLFFCYFCALTFIGRPITITCILRQFIFGISFVMCISCVLGKTMMVVIAFNLTQPRSSRRMWLNSRVTNTLVLVCTAIQVIICAGWLAHSPPFQYTDNKSKAGTIIVECNKGSPIAYSCTMGYMGFLASLCFVVAYLARKLPGSFNEAKLITFSMLIFGAVWISFIPAYLSTTGKYMVAVEVFAILSSSSGLLACIFLPKVYIIILTPEINKIKIKTTNKLKPV